MLDSIKINDLLFDVMVMIKMVWHVDVNKDSDINLVIFSQHARKMITSTCYIECFI